MTHPVVAIIYRHSEPDLTLCALLFGLCVIGFVWTLAEVVRRFRAQTKR